MNGRQHGEIRLQERSEEGITDVLPSAHVIIEAKIGVGPDRPAEALRSDAEGRKELKAAVVALVPRRSRPGVRRLAGDV